MYRNYGSNLCPGFLVKCWLAADIDYALRFQELPEPLRIHVVGPLIDIDKIRYASGLRNTLGCSNEGVGNCDDDRARLHTCRDQGKPERVCSAAYPCAILHVAVLCKFGFKTFHHGTAHK